MTEKFALASRVIPARNSRDEDKTIYSITQSIMGEWKVMAEFEPGIASWRAREIVDVLNIGAEIQADREAS